MSEVHKTVFISYRRKAASFHARAIFENLKSHGYDVFMDVESIDAGDFKRIIENQIKAKAHFLVVLTAGTVGKFDNPTDMMRYEIEYAMEYGRNIVPLLINDFKFNKTTLKSLTGKLADLPKRNGAPIRHELFDGSMSNLRDRFLSKPIDVVVSSTPASDKTEVERTLADVAAEPVPTQEELSAEAYFAMGYEKQEAGDLEGAIANYNEAIRVNPQYTEGYYNRGSARHDNDDIEGAIADYTEAIRLNSQFIEAYNNRGGLRQLKGEFSGAIADFDEAIRLNPQLALSYNNRGSAKTAGGNLIAAIVDYDEAIRLNPSYTSAFYNRGIARQDNGDISGALADYTEAIKLNDKYINALNNRGRLHGMQGDFIQAITDFDNAIRTNPKESFIYVNRGIVRGKQGDLMGVISDFTEAIRLKPKEADLYIDRGEGYFALGKYQDALDDFQQANNLRTSHKMTLADLAITQVMLENYGDSKRIWRGLVEQDARYGDADWVSMEFNWRPELVEAARKLIAEL